MTKRIIHVITFGCQMNKFDSELFSQSLEDAGHTLTENIEEADTVLFNTCSVRDQAENRVLSAIGMLKEKKQNNPNFKIGVMGCMAQRWGKNLPDKYNDVDLVIGTREFHRIAELLEECENNTVVATRELTLAESGILPENRHTKSGFSAYIAVMRGCNNFCTYCIVPYVRGREESRNKTEIIHEAQRAVDEGAIEITLLGQNVCAYGKEFTPSVYITELLQEIGNINGIKRLRFISSHPKDIKEDLFTAMRDIKPVCEILQVSAQSGSNPVLKAMNRQYTRERYDEIISMGKSIVPDIAFSSDFIVGFPGETEEDFLQTLDLVKQTEYLNIFAFRYSPRPGTKAEALDDDVPQQEKENRLQALLKAQEEVNNHRNNAFVAEGKIQSVLVEGISKKDGSKLTGRNRHGGIVVFDAPKDIKSAQEYIGKEIDIKIVSSTTLTLFGELVD